MFYQQINGTDPEKVFIITLNAYTTAAITRGQPVVFAYNGTNDGIAVTQPVTAKLALLAGIVESASIANGSYGLVQCYGHNANAQVSGGTNDAAVGDKLQPRDQAFVLIDAGGTYVAAESGLIICGEAYTATTTATKKVFIRCM